MDSVILSKNMEKIANELLDVAPLNGHRILVIGCSTSEVAGERIGTAGSEAIAAAIFEPLNRLKQTYGFHLAFQACEHLNRAIVVERRTAEQFALDEVTVIPVREAGGAMAAYAYRHFEGAVVVETIRADAGIDIGDTLIGMHLKPVAVPVRPTIKQLGQAHVTMARTRPKLIGGARARYE